tara:strand:- start:9634 stop:9984 length:351 start_codon:yes stop_codon:yes gene_type:complete
MKKVLIIDDNVELCRDLKSVLENRLKNNKIEFTNCPVEGYKKSKENYDLVISDYNMPKMSGKVLSEILKFDNPSIKIMMLSGNREEINKSSKNVDMMALKGGDLDKLIRKVKILLS